MIALSSLNCQHDIERIYLKTKQTKRAKISKIETYKTKMDKNDKFIIMIGDFDIFLLLVDDKVAKNSRLQIIVELGMVVPSLKNQNVTKLLKSKNHLFDVHT